MSFPTQHQMANPHHKQFKRILQFVQDPPGLENTQTMSYQQSIKKLAWYTGTSTNQIAHEIKKMCGLLDDANM